MQRLQFRHTRNFNLKYKKWGHLFQGRYKAILCQKDSYFLELSAYIHLNPVRAGLVRDPHEYPWSSYRWYIQAGSESLIDTDFLLRQFSDRKDLARKEYAHFVSARLHQGHRKEFYEVKNQCFLGTDEFVEDIQKWLTDEPPTEFDIALEEVVVKVGAILGIPIELFYSASRNRLGAKGRAVVGYLARKLGNYQIKTVAEHFGRNPVVLSKGMMRLERELSQNETLDETMVQLEQNLIANRKATIVY
jgi:hypothetical protein